MARQMTLIESALFRKIEARECLGQGWQGLKKYHRAPNISRIIDHTNDVRGPRAPSPRVQRLRKGQPRTLTTHTAA